MYTRNELIQLTGVKESTFIKNEKRQLEKLGEYTKIGRGKKAIYHFTQPIQPPTKVKFEQVFGYKSRFPKIADKYIKYIIANSQGFVASDRDIAKEIGELRQNVLTVRQELEHAGFLKPIEQEEICYFSRQINSNKWIIELNKEKWNEYYKLFYQISNQVKRGEVQLRNLYGEKMENGFFYAHQETSKRLGYYVKSVYVRRTFTFDLLLAIQQYV